MHSIKLYFPERKELLLYQYQYSRCFRKMYSNIDNLDELKDSLLLRCQLIDVGVYDYISTEVELKYNKHLCSSFRT